MTRLGLGYSSISDRVLHDGDRDQKRKTDKFGMGLKETSTVQLEVSLTQRFSSPSGQRLRRHQGLNEHVQS
jgi:hypothetical protein